MKKEEKEKEVVEEKNEVNDTVEQQLELIDKLDDEIGELQEKIVKEKCDNVELQSEIEKEKSENLELEKENKKLRRSISFFRLVLFFIFTVMVFIGGWYIGTQLVVLDEFLYGDIEDINPEEDREISFSQSAANEGVKNFYGEFMSKKGFISKVLYDEIVPEYYDLFNVYEYRLSVVPRVDEQLYGDTMYPYVTYASFKKGYDQVYRLDDLDNIFKLSTTYPKLVDGDKVLFDDYLDTGVEVSFSVEKIKYTAKDKIYTMTGTYQEVASAYSVLRGTVVTGSFDLQYKMDDDGNKYIVGMVINKEDMNLIRNDI